VNLVMTTTCPAFRKLADKGEIKQLKRTFLSLVQEVSPRWWPTSVRSTTTNSVVLLLRRATSPNARPSSTASRPRVVSKYRRHQAFALNALDVEATKALIRETQSQIVINVGSAFLNMSVLRACIDTGVAYLDTAIHEEPGKICETPPWYGNYEWNHLEECKQKNITAILGVGFDRVRQRVCRAGAATAFRPH